MAENYKFLDYDGLKLFKELLDENGYKDSSGSTSSSVPVGTILPFGGATTPDDFLLCDGSKLSVTTYSALYDAIGTIYGGGGKPFTCLI